MGVAANHGFGSEFLKLFLLVGPFLFGIADSCFEKVPCALLELEKTAGVRPALFRHFYTERLWLFRVVEFRWVIPT